MPSPTHGKRYSSRPTATLNPVKTEIISFSIAVHEPSGFYLVGDKWEPDATLEDQYLRGGTDYENHLSDEDDEEDFYILEKKIAISRTYSDDDLEQYEEEKSNFEDGRNEYYGHSMNGGGGRREFSKMYGDGNYLTFDEWLADNTENGVEYCDPEEL